MTDTVTPITRFERVGAHSHVKGLGLDEKFKALPVADGMVGQIAAREAAGIVVQMIRKGKMAGRAVLLAGPPGTGKTAIAMGIARELGRDVPFITLHASEIYSSELKKTEVLMRAVRKAIGVRLREKRKVYEGELTHFELKTARHPYNPYQEVAESARITLTTTNESRSFTVSGGLASNMLAQGIKVGDVVQIDAETGRVIRLGRSESAAERYEIADYTEKPISRPRGPVEKEKEFVYLVTLYDLDMMESRGRGGFFTLLFGGVAGGEIDSETRRRVDEYVKERVEEGTAEIIPGVLFIDDVSMLDIEAFSFLSTILESELAPIIVFATNRGITKVRGTDLESPHGMPLDLLDRLLIINTDMYSKDEIREILKIRAREEGVSLNDDALEYLVEVGASKSLRYAVQLLTPAYEKARTEGRDKVSKDDVEHVVNLFSDVARSIEYVKRYEEYMMR
ncbi:MAG: RuvB-like domain-containing protein [Nitrososphaerota archaeon]|nr:RuvB-like domain-containing protein [Candidatus Bathyarchaeota archaeon]MDW8061341.1 RuvB-like domain-containing protein [Nitrososphaerota archaeon]